MQPSISAWTGSHDTLKLDSVSSRAKRLAGASRSRGRCYWRWLLYYTCKLKTQDQSIRQSKTRRFHEKLKLDSDSPFADSLQFTYNRLRPSSFGPILRFASRHAGQSVLFPCLGDQQVVVIQPTKRGAFRCRSQIVFINENSPDLRGNVICMSFFKQIFK